MPRHTAFGALALLVFGCATPMSRSPDSGRPLAPTEGIVVGSVLLRVVEGQGQAPLPVASAFLVSARRIRYSLEAGASRDTRSIMEQPITLKKRYSLTIAPDIEKVFVTRMPAGPHVFDRLVPRGYEEAAALLGIRFTVAPGAATYIGRLVFEFPEELPLSKGMPQGLYSLQPTIRIEDAQDATVDSIRGAHGRIVESIDTDLMQTDR